MDHSTHLHSEQVTRQLQQQPQQGFSAAPSKPWHLTMTAPVIKNLRSRMAKTIFLILKSLTPAIVEAQMLPQLSMWLESSFFTAADSAYEYEDFNTLAARINQYLQYWNSGASYSSGNASLVLPPSSEQDGAISSLQQRQAIASPASSQHLEETEGFEAIEDEEQTFHRYCSTASVEDWRPHPDILVESSSLASVALPVLAYKTKLPRGVFSTGKLSAPQMEAISYACQRHESFLSSGERQGFFLGDGAGVGKGRQVAGMVYENWLRGRRRHVWFSASTDLIVDARRDLDDIGAEIECFEMKGLSYSKISAGDGIFFVTYAGIIGSSGRKTRLKQLLCWMNNENFDGCLIFDECHKAKNLNLDESKSGGTKSAKAVFSIQSSCPNARVVYCSATGISDPRDMVYISSLIQLIF